MLAKNNDNYKVMLRVSRVGREERLNQDGEMEQAGARLAVAVNIFVCGEVVICNSYLFPFPFVLLWRKSLPNFSDRHNQNEG